MTEIKSTESTAGTSPSAGASQTSASGELRAAEHLVDEAKAAASEAGTQARKLASDKAGELQGAAASHLGTFAEAIRTAGDQLAEKEPGPASDLVRQAAKGLEELSGALSHKSSGDMIAGIREFGRQNPVGFLAGSMLAGFALARFAGSSSPQHTGRSSRMAGDHGDHGRHTSAGLGSMSSERSDTSVPKPASHSPASAGHGNPLGVLDPEPFGNDQSRNSAPDSTGRTDV